ncbi:dienelactone hydrolase family protein [Pantoea cypripedii]|uniref:dienelactone hydrolase family protein n=1 Tax=Pantoea cypripedii TaxID=55209 RepID=UPI002FC956C0
MMALAEAKVAYRSGESALTGVLVYDRAASEPCPGIVMGPNMMGITESNIAQARKLASEGYAVLVADLYGITPASAEEASVAMKAIKDTREERSRMHAALAFLSSDPRVDCSRMAAVGFCYGGHCVLELARSGAELQAVFCIHGTLDTLSPAVKGDMHARVVVLNGAGDPFVSPQQILGFCQEMVAAEAEFMFVNYAGAVHSFTYPRADVEGKMEYNEAVCHRAFSTVFDVLHQVFH